MQTATPTPSTLNNQAQFPSSGHRVSDEPRLTNAADQPAPSKEACDQASVKEPTHTDLELAQAYFPILVDLARSQEGQTIFYSELVTEAKRRNPDNAVVQRAAIATSAGRRLDALRAFTSARGLPDLSALVVNKATKDNGGAYKRTFDGGAIRQAILASDWNSVTASFGSYVADEKRALIEREAAERAAKRKRVTEKEAREMLWAFSRVHPEHIAEVSYDLKEAAIVLIRRGQDVQEAIEQARQALEAKRRRAS